MRFAVAVPALCLMIPAAALLAEDAEEKSTVPIDEWLVKETVRLVLPAFHDEKPGAFDRDDFLELAVDLESLEFEGSDKDQAAKLVKERKKLKTIY
ncbi:MAG: hypothetical protein KJ956_14175, partial [Actinobacteria bacterium]|nr:hypothetical protein [Actinomycetota bacterium]